MAPVEQLTQQLLGSDWALVENFVSQNTVERLEKEQQEFFEQGLFRPAGIRQSAQVREDIRSDVICWWHPETLSPLQKEVWSQLEHLRTALNRHLFLGITHFETHYARYSPGSFYERHLDQIHGSEKRVVSFILYLNQNWDEARDGGSLRIYESEGRFQDIAPQAGRLVCFLSESVEHEVLAPDKRIRLSLTGWFRRN